MQKKSEKVQKAFHIQSHTVKPRFFYDIRRSKTDKYLMQLESPLRFISDYMAFIIKAYKNSQYLE